MAVIQLQLESSTNCAVPETGLVHFHPACCLVVVVFNLKQVDQEKLEMIREILGYDYGSAITDDLKLRLKKNNKLESSQNQ